MGTVCADPKQQVMPSNPRGRLYFVDWLRVVLTINVVVMHALLTYTSEGSR
jgi:peptidoglycan/LPS O-acetylase OafA/YrhL